MAHLGQVSLTLAEQDQTAAAQNSTKVQSPTVPSSRTQTSGARAQASGPQGTQTSGQQGATRPNQQTAQQTATRQSQQPTGKQAAVQKAPAARPPVIPPGFRPLSLSEGSAIVQGMAWADDEEGLSPDCSHLVHTLYQQAGYSYPYASSLDLYGGTGPFLQVRYAHPGDLVVWRGHVGIVVNPREHSFFSTTSSGARTASYRSAYWRARGYPHFLRYLTKSPLTGSGSTTEAANRKPQH